MARSLSRVEALTRPLGGRIPLVSRKSKGKPDSSGPPKESKSGRGRSKAGTQTKPTLGRTRSKFFSHLLEITAGRRGASAVSSLPLGPTHRLHTPR